MADVRYVGMEENIISNKSDQIKKIVKEHRIYVEECLHNPAGNYSDKDRFFYKLFEEFLIESLNQVREETRMEINREYHSFIFTNLVKKIKENLSIANNIPINESEYVAKTGFVLLPERRCSHCSCKNNSAIEGVSICCICQRVKEEETKR